MYLNDLSHSSFITINDPDEGFTEILEEFPNALLDSLDGLDLTVNVSDIFPTSISLSLKGYKEDILEATGLITQLLISYHIYNFYFILHTLEQLNE